MQLIDILKNPEYRNKRIIELIICNLLDIDTPTLYAHYEREISTEQADKIQELYRAYSVDNKPLEYIFEKVSFFGVDFKIDHRALIPRPETEYMIQAVRDHISNLSYKPTLLDIWTWCGVLWISTLLTHSDHIKEAIFTDISAEALSLAKENIEKHLVGNDYNGSEAIQLIETNLIDGLDYDSFENVIIVANLPYIPAKTFDNDVEESAKLWEPRVAFVWGDDWLDYYRQLLNKLIENKWLAKTTLFFEMITWQKETLLEEYKDHITVEEIATFHFNIKIIKVTAI